jgi:hypothetical protein
MSKKYPECPLYNHDTCKELYNQKVCAIVRKDKTCLNASDAKKIADGPLLGLARLF